LFCGENKYLSKCEQYVHSTGGLAGIAGFNKPCSMGSVRELFLRKFCYD